MRILSDRAFLTRAAVKLNGVTTSEPWAMASRRIRAFPSDRPGPRSDADSPSPLEKNTSGEGKPSRRSRASSGASTTTVAEIGACSLLISAAARVAVAAPCLPVREAPETAMTTVVPRLAAARPARSREPGRTGSPSRRPVTRTASKSSAYSVKRWTMAFMASSSLAT